MDLALVVASWSKDPSTKCGAVIVNSSRRVVGIGYNGLPDRVYDDPEILNDREKKYALVIHAEMNAIFNATSNVEGCTVYVSHPSCPDCAKMLVQAGVHKVMWPTPDPVWIERWDERIKQSMEIFKLGSVVVEVLEPNQE